MGRALDRLARRVLSYRVHTVVEAPPEAVFDYCSDLRNELEWNPDARSIEILSDGAVGAGTVYRATWRGTRPTMVRIVRYERPRSWRTEARAVGMAVLTEGAVRGAGVGSVLSVTVSARPRGPLGIIAPLALLLMRRAEGRNLERIKASLRDAATGSPMPGVSIDPRTGAA